MSAPAEVLDSGTGPRVGWLVAVAVVALLGLGSQQPWSGGDPGDGGATRRVSTVTSATPPAPAHWKGRIILSEAAREPVLTHRQRYPVCPHDTDAPTSWLLEHAHRHGCW